MTLPASAPDDHTAIMAVIARETTAFMNSDFDGWAACWVQDERTRDVCTSSTFGTTVLTGWDALSTYMKDVFAKGSGCEKMDFQRDNIQITVNGDLAHVVFDGRSLHTDGKVETTSESRAMERHDGTWRILYASFILRGHQRTDANRLAVDGKGKVLCAPDAVLAALKGHPGLQISNGHLRATRPSWDQILQDGLRCAAEQHSYFQQYRHQVRSGEAFRLPVVLGETDAGEVVVCTLFARDEMTFVDFQNDQDIAARLAVAKVIFGLSNGQLALAQRIVNGESLTHAAAALGISINTARTHLSRIYDKTGVNAQTALVRTLLSIG